MEIKITEEDKNRIVFEIKDETSGIINLLKKELNKDGKVKAAAFRVDHPLVGKPTMLIETEGTYKPKDALKTAIKNINKNLESLKKSLSKDLK